MIRFKDMSEKTVFAMFVIACVTGLQIIAWVMGYDGAVFAFVSLLIGAIVGSILGFSLHKPPRTK